MANFNPGFPKLKGREDYQFWKVSAQAILEMDGLWDIVVGNETEQDETKVAVLDRKAKCRLVLMVETVNFVHFQAEVTAKGVWDKLKSAFDDSGLMRRVGLLRILITTKLDECDNMEDFVNRIISTAHKLSGAGMEINDEWIGTLLLAGLSSRYEPMIMAIENSGVSISSDKIKTKLLQETSQHEQSKGETSMYTNPRKFHANTHNKHAFKHSQSGQNANGGQQGQSLQSGHGQQQTSARNFKCFKCHKYGHFSRDCRSSKSSGSNYGNNGGRSEMTWSCTTGKYNNNDWYIDSGASAHMSKDAAIVTEVRASDSDTVTVANSTTLNVEGQGLVKLSSSLMDINVHNVLIVPEICANLLSVSALVRKGLRLVFDSQGCAVIEEKSGKIIANASEMNGLYRLDAKTRVSANSLLVPKINSVEMLWHRRLGHAGVDTIRRISGDILINNGNLKLPQCEICVLGKHARQPFQRSITKSSSVLEIIHTDVCGPMQTRSIQSSRYFLTFIDDYSRKVVVYGMAKKSMVLEIFKEFKLKAEQQTGKLIKILRSDNGTEYCNGAMSEFLRSSGIIHQTTVPYTPEQNGVAERMNRTLVEKARCMLFDAKLPTKFWGEAVVTAAYLVNRIPRRECNKSPEELWSGKKPDLSNLRIFGCKAMIHIPSVKRNKFDPTSKTCTFIGYCTTTKGYRFYDQQSNKICISRDVKFFEDSFLNDHAELYNFNFNGNQNEVEEYSHEANTSSGSTLPTHHDVSNVSETEPDNPNDPDYLPESPIDIPAPISPWKSNRVRKTVDRYVSNAVEVKEKTLPDPVTISEALSGRNAERWREAMNSELASLKENRTWSLVDLPAGRKAINNKWVYKTKIGENGQINRFKARLVVKGCSQREGIDYAETFSPVVRYSTIRFLLAMAAKLDLDIEHMDAVTAFLQGDLKEEIYMQQPAGMEDGSGRVCRLHKSLYGLKQASRAWNEKLGGCLLKSGLKCSQIDTCVYYLLHNTDILIIAVYVDDLLLFCNNHQMKHHFKKLLLANFKMVDNGEAKYFLGMNIKRDRQVGTIHIN